MVKMIARQRWVMGLMSLAHGETCNQLRQYGIERGQRKAYAKPLPLPFTYTPGVFAYLFKLLEQGDALLIENRPASVVCAQAMLCPDVLPTAESGDSGAAGDVQTLGSAGEIQGFRDCLEVTNMPEIHDTS